jgi:translation initiation factor 2 beta subunit (eIF-2beta)/eIF-5
MVNLNGSEDPSYRYQMDYIQIKIEGKGKMIKTYLVNLEKVAEQIGRPMDFILSYIGTEVGASSKIDKVDNQIRPWVGSEQTQKTIQEHIFKFVKNYINCRKCGNPETKPYVEGKKKNAMLKLKCASCGEDSEIRDAHKIVKAMINTIDK